MAMSHNHNTVQILIRINNEFESKGHQLSRMNQGTMTSSLFWQSDSS
jgi:hypothetical protein